MFSSSPRYSTLTQQVARLLEEQIRAGILRDSLPGERSLAASMQVGRRTIRAAAAILRQKKLIRTAHGAETKILKAPEARASRRPMRNIGLLVPLPLNQLQPYATVFIDPLRTLLYENGFRLDTHFGQRYFSRKPAAALSRLVARFPTEGWILLVSNQACQAWFHAQGIATVVIGTAHEDVALPYVDLDMQATSRHAAQVLLRKGHRRLGLVIAASDWVGDRKTEQGFLEGVRQFGSKAEGHVFKHAGTVGALRQTLTQILQSPVPPTALLVVNPYNYLTVAGILAEKGLQVPRDISLLCRDDEYCFRHLPITPSRYVYDPNARAKVIFSTLMGAMQAGGRKAHGTRSVLMLPKFLAGASIAPPAAVASSAAT